MCKDNKDWDAPLSDEMWSAWEQWRTSLLKLRDLNIPRCYKPNDFGNVKLMELHHFSDASSTGYGQCSYLRQVDEHNRVQCTFVMGKARVTPLKVVTIPRLELTAALLSVKVSEMLKRELRMENIQQFFWTDSKVALGYITNEARRFHVFVANRVQQIRDATVPSQWNHIRTDVNPADVASRGIGAEEFMNKSDWINGPRFLWDKYLPSSATDFEYPIEPADPDVRKVNVAVTHIEFKPQSFEVERLEYFSDWFRAKRAIASCLRLKRNLQTRVKMRKGTASEDNGEDLVSNSLTVEDLVTAETEIIRQVQQQSFGREIKALKSLQTKPDGTKQIQATSPIYRLNPYLDENGILRVGGRLFKAKLPLSVRSPVILPRHSHITTLIIRHFHASTAHQGRGLTTNAIRENGYWIIGCSSAVTQYISKCVTCRRLHRSTNMQKMADLPDDRVNPSPPFTYSGVDLFGPWLIKEGRKERKRYGVIFTCMASRAVHLETVNSLETSSFINALRRFISIRGPVRQLRSDCGTNFVGAEKELKEALKEMDQSAVNDFLLKQSCDFIEFQRNVPSASHMGGVWERQIRTIRRVLSGLLKEQGSQLDDESLRTLLCEAAATINSRPLTYDNLNDPSSLVALTPNHLLTMKTKIILPPPGNFQRTDMYCRRRWRRVQHLANEFWYRWRREYLHSLQPRSKWNRAVRDLKVGDLVLIKDDDLPRNQWKLCRVHATFIDDDGHVRKVKLAVGNSSIDNYRVSYLERPVHKLVIILENNVSD